MTDTKTGALVCKMADKENEFTYQPLAFITNVPGSFSDEDFKSQFDIVILGELVNECEEILFRADIHSTSNEVQEEFEKLHSDWAGIPQFDFRKKHVAV